MVPGPAVGLVFVLQAQERQLSPQLSRGPTYGMTAQLKRQDPGPRVCCKHGTCGFQEVKSCFVKSYEWICNTSDCCCLSGVVSFPLQPTCLPHRTGDHSLDALFHFLSFAYTTTLLLYLPPPLLDQESPSCRIRRDDISSILTLILRGRINVFLLRTHRTFPLPALTVSYCLCS